MSKFKKSLLLASLLMTSNAKAQDGIYVALGAGIGKVISAKSNQDFPLLLKSPAIFATPIDSIVLSFKKAFQFNGAVGYQWGNYRGEISFNFLKAKYNEFKQTPNPLEAQGLGGSLRSHYGFINGYYDFPISNAFMPFFGVGVGYAHIKNSLQHSDLVHVLPDGGIENLPTLKFNMKDKSFAYQIIPGVKINLTHRVALTADYRFTSTTKKMTALNSKLKTHSLNLGFIYKF